MEEWRFIDNHSSDEAAINLAIEEAIFSEKILGKMPPTLRFWQSKRATVVGYSQSVEAEVNLKVCIKEGVEVARRLSGGGAVYQDLGNLNYAITIESDHYLVKGLDVPQSLRKLCLGVIITLKALGINPAFEPPGNILVNGKKVSGTAQARRKNVILHHGTLLVNANLDLLYRVLNIKNFSDTTKGVTSKKSLVTNLAEILDQQMSMKKIQESLQYGFEEAFAARLVKDSLSQTEKDSAKNLYVKKYSRREWVFLH